MSADELQALQDTPAKPAASGENGSGMAAGGRFLGASQVSAGGMPSASPTPVVASPSRTLSSRRIAILASFVAVVVSLACVDGWGHADALLAGEAMEPATRLRFPLEDAEGLTLVGTASRYRPDAPLFPLSVFAAGLYVHRHKYCGDANVQAELANPGPFGVSWESAADEERTFASVVEAPGSKALVLKFWREVPAWQVAEVIAGPAPVHGPLAGLATALSQLDESELVAGTTARLAWHSGIMQRLHVEVGGRLVYSGGAAEARGVLGRVLVSQATSSTRLKRSVRNTTPGLCAWEGTSSAKQGAASGSAVTQETSAA
eukprot:CAMPEP_0185167134 /NCGR_PEP_ID=MMETSP1139-20130426/13758_1 /TAXON_ID=298111 /ORGANISM="Pavlova sp., Strain CCMP459" /LENGTH=317 /DNA_ID=CAMNT_0027732605 /DNA_START=98 /DNA_END=1051 /DNA_ORIENTATION=+